MQRSFTLSLLLLFGLVLAMQMLGWNAPVTAQKKSDSVVKVTATADKPDADGKQTVSILLTHEAGWHSYANPVGQEDLASAQTTVTITGKAKLDDVKVDYPTGKLIKDKIVGDYK